MTTDAPIPKTIIPACRYGLSTQLVNVLDTHSLQYVYFKDAPTLFTFTFPVGPLDQATEPRIVHIRIRTTKRKKYQTVIEGLPRDLNLKRILSALTKTACHCGGQIETQPTGKAIVLQGDKRLEAVTFLKDEDICNEENIKIHGF